MRRIILLSFIGVFLIKNVTPSKIYEYSNLAWLFGSNDKSNDRKEETRTVCQTQECKKMADIILENMNKSVDPCNDFYEYACGRWPEHNPIPEGLPKWTVPLTFQSYINRQIQDILDAGPKDDDLYTVKHAKKWYKSCMDTDAMEKQGLLPLISTLSRIGGWPMIMEPDEWDEWQYSWQNVDDQYMRLTGENSFHNVHMTEFEEKELIYIGTPHLPLFSYKLQSEIPLGSEEEEEDSSDEEKQSKQDDSQEPGSEGEDHSKDDEDDYDYGSGDSDDDNDDDDSDDNENDYDYDYEYNDNDDDDNSSGSGSGDSDDDDNDDDDDNYSGSGDSNNDNNDDDDSGDDDDDNYSGSGDSNNDNNDDDGSGDDDDDDDNDSNKRIRNVKKVNKKKTTGEISHRKHKKLGHNGPRKNNIRMIKKHNSQVKKQRVERRTIPRKVESKRTQRVNHREKLRTWKNKRNYVKKIRREKRKKILDNAEATHRSTMPWVNITTTNEKNKIMRKQYADYISKVARIIAKEYDTEISQEHLDKDIKDMIDFQLKLIKIVRKSRRDILVELTLDDFQKWNNNIYERRFHHTINSQVDWVYKIVELFDEAYVPMDGDADVGIGSLYYFRALLFLLERTPSRTIVNYIHWNFISGIIQTTTNEMRELYDSWERINEEEEKPELPKPKLPRSSICAKSEGIKHVLAYDFVKKYFSDDIVQTASDMLDDVQKEVEYLIKESDWMDDDTKEFTLAKLRNLKKLIGYPDWYRNSTLVNRYLQGLIIGKSYYENTLNYRKYIKYKDLRILTEVKAETLSVDPSVVNAFFIPWKNAIILSAADFQSPFFAYNRPQSINFGTIGSLIAHEVNHGFDTAGYLFDKDGTYVEWLSTMAKVYGKKTKCFVEQFNNYPIDKTSNKKIKNYGKQTIRDNIADTMGLQAIFKAYERRQRECNGSDIALPGLEKFTNNQLFFLSFANLWCEAIDPHYLMMLAKYNVHSIGRLRLIGSVSNSDDFAKAYNCPINSPMNPKKKCNIWK